MTSGDGPPLHERNPVGRFSDRADDYARYRPSYPAEAFDAILRGLGDPERLSAADIGAGTGISSRLLAERGVRVAAVEPNAGMRVAAQPHPLVRFQEGTAEQTGLPGAGCDLVLCAQAFHWFRPHAALAEFARILRAGGRVAMVWNVKDSRDEFTRGYTEQVRQAAGNDAAADRHDHPEGLAESPLFRDYRVEHFAYRQDVDLEGLFGRALSSSYVPKSGVAYEDLMTGLRELHGRHADPRGNAALVYDTRVFLAQRR